MQEQDILISHDMLVCMLLCSTPTTFPTVIVHIQGRVTYVYPPKRSPNLQLQLKNQFHQSTTGRRHSRTDL
jgi:hypothetical protein